MSNYKSVFNLISEVRILKVMDKITRKLKSIQLVRIVCKPWMDKKLERKYAKYLQSGYGERLKELKNTHQGERCFIIGNGPSLQVEDLACLRGEYTFSANRIYQIFDKTDWRPWAYVVVDPALMHTERDKVLKVPCTLKFLPYFFIADSTEPSAYRVYEAVKTFVLNPGSDTTAYISEDISQGLSRGYTVTFSSIQIAIYMGFSEIYLLGVDFNYSSILGGDGKVRQNDNVKDYFATNEKPLCPMNLEACFHAYNVAKKYADEHGVKIRNATRGGKLEVFERVDFDGLFPNKE